LPSTDRPSAGRPLTVAPPLSGPLVEPGRSSRLAGALGSLAALGSADLRVRYGRGRAWALRWLLDPAGLVVVYLLLLVFIVDRPGQAPALTLACAVLPFQLLVATAVNAMSALALRRSILLNMPFERTVIPVGSACAEAAGFAAGLLLLAPLMLVYGEAPTPALLLLPLVVAVTLLLAVALAFPAALFGLWFPELRGLAVNVLRTLFFLAPGLVALPAITGDARTLVKLNPLTGIFESYRSVVIEGTAPAGWMLAYPLAVAAVLLATSLRLYRREQGSFAKMLG
jgi:lipopolysaccharide transport system permease protein